MSEMSLEQLLTQIAEREGRLIRFESARKQAVRAFEEIGANLRKINAMMEAEDKAVQGLYDARNAALLKRKFEQTANGVAAPVNGTYRIPTLVGVERSARRKHRGPRRYVAKGERVKPPAAAKHGKRDKGHKPQRGGKREIAA